MKLFLTIFLFLHLILLGQNDIHEIVNSELGKGHFKGTVFYAERRNIGITLFC